MRQRVKLLVLLVFVLSVVTPLATAQNAAGNTKATKFRIADPENVLGGKLHITVNGRERKIHDEAFAAWLINDGRDVVFSSRDGAGGFENEGQSLRIYNVSKRTTRKILSEYVAVIAVQAVKTSRGATALLVKMADGGLGGSYFAVVDPRRGEVFYRRWTEATAVNGDRITLAFYKADDFEAINDERGWKTESPNTVISTTNTRPYKTETYDLKKILTGRVIYNRPSYLEQKASAVPFSREVKIYLWDANSNASPFGLVAVIRHIGGAAVLRLTLQMLFAGASNDEAANGLTSSTFGMKFQDLTFQNGVAVVKFSQPPNQTNYGSLGPMIFSEAIEKTAKQFPTVKRVHICAVGDTLIDAQLEKPFPRCK
jgi:Sporulation and spore germination